MLVVNSQLRQSPELYEFSDQQSLNSQIYIIVITQMGEFIVKPQIEGEEQFANHIRRIYGFNLINTSQRENYGLKVDLFSFEEKKVNKNIEDPLAISYLHLKVISYLRLKFQSKSESLPTLNC